MELKARTAQSIAQEEEMLELGAPDGIEPELVYLKSEADKVIAELKADYKEACDRLQTANLIKDEQLAVTRHQKYKRCIAMANMCAYAYDKYLQVKCNATKMGKDGVDLYLRSRRKAFHFRRWQYFWMKTAEKFKEHA